MEEEIEVTSAIDALKMFIPWVSLEMLLVAFCTGKPKKNQTKLIYLGPIQSLD